MKYDRSTSAYGTFHFPLKRLSIQQQLQHQLSHLLRNSQWFEGLLSNFGQQGLSVSRLSSVTPITYRCAIAMQLSRHCSLSPWQISQQVFSFLETQLTSDNGEFPQLTLTMKLVEPGWLDFQVSDRALAFWLQFLGEGMLKQPKSPKISSNTENLFPIEYTYARCCSLLRLGEQQGLISLHSKTLADLSWPWKDPNPIPWLTDTHQLRLQDRTALVLLSQIIITVDRFVNHASESWNKLATQLSESVLNFERYCRIFGELAQNNPQLAQARLGLIAVSQHLLKWLWYSHREEFPRFQL